jgi:hypothetical protein
MNIELKGPVFGWDDYIQNKVIASLREAIDRPVTLHSSFSKEQVRAVLAATRPVLWRRLCGRFGRWLARFERRRW